MKHYKIRDKNTGLFKGPGSYSRWSTAGKVWSHRTIRAALGLFTKYRMNIPSDWEVVEFSMVETATYNAKDFYENFYEKKVG